MLEPKQINQESVGGSPFEVLYHSISNNIMNNLFIEIIIQIHIEYHIKEEFMESIAKCNKSK